MSTVCFYEVLGISKTATDKDIKKAYRKLAIQWHPDKNPNDPQKAAEMFKMIGEAYETLSDPQARREYDLSRSEGQSGGRSQRHNFHHPFSHGREFDIFNQFFADMESFHNDFHSQGRHGARGGRRDPFSDPFFSGGGFGMGMGGMDDMMGFGGMGGMSSMMSSSSSSFGGGGGMSTSSSTSSSIGPDGIKHVRTEKITTHSDGRQEKTVEEYTVDRNGTVNVIENTDNRRSAIEDFNGKSSKSRGNVRQVTNSTSSRSRSGGSSSSSSFSSRNGY